MPNRLALYSSKDWVIAGLTKRWPQLAAAHDLLWLSHDTDQHAARLAEMIMDWVEKAGRS